MLIYAGIDEAGYGPFFGPLTVGRCVIRIPRAPGPGDPDATPQAAADPPNRDDSSLDENRGDDPRGMNDRLNEGRNEGQDEGGDEGGVLPDLWARLSQAVSPSLSGRRGRVVVADSKKLKTKAAGLSHLERGCLAFAGLWNPADAHHVHPDPHPADAGGGTDSETPATNENHNGGWDVGRWLDALGETSHRELGGVPWYDEAEAGPWDALPAQADPGELAVERGMLRQTARRIGVEVADLGCAVVFEDRFNQQVAATRSKAAVNFTCIAGHLQSIWQRFGHQWPIVVVDRQSGRTRYREVLAMNFPDARVSVRQESAAASAYLITQPRHRRSMEVRFQTQAEARHLPVALASMLAKYNRELLMARFNRTFTRWLPEVPPTAGYGQDAQRFWKQVRPHLDRLGIDPQHLRRQA